LTPNEFGAMVRDIRVMEACISNEEKDFLECERPCWDKLGKSVVAARELKAGHKLSRQDLAIKVSKSSEHVFLFVSLSSENLPGVLSPATF